MNALRIMALLFPFLLLSSAAYANPGENADRPTHEEPRNWPTITRFIADRYELAGRVMTARVYAKKSDYFNCGYRGTQGRLKAFTLLAGPHETLTGYMPAELGEVLESVLASSTSTQLTVQIHFDPNRLSDRCIDQVDILKWSLGWQYPPETLGPPAPGPETLPTRAEIRELASRHIWKELTDRDKAPIGQQVQIAGGARLSSSMHCAFRGAWRTHWAIQLFDGRGRVIHAYLPKSEQGQELVDHLALHREAPLLIQGRVVKVAMSNYCMPQIEITGWSIQQPDRPSPEASPPP